MTNEEHRLSHVLATALFISMTVVAGIGVLMLSSLGTNAKTEQLVTLASQISELQEEIKTSREELREAERAVYDAELIFKILADADAAIVVLDSQGRITLWSKGAETLFGYSREEVIGYGIAFLIPKDTWETHRAAYDRAMNGGGKTPFEKTRQVTAVHKDGHEIPLHSNVWGVPGRQAVAMFTKVE